MTELNRLHELLAGDETQRRISAIGEGTVPTYHGTETVDEARLVVENAKLRELAYILVYCMQDKDCDGCRLNGERGEIIADPLYACDGLHELLREMEIEVEV